MTKLALSSVSEKGVNYLVSLCHTNTRKKPKFRTGQQVRIRRRIDTFHRGYKIQFTEEMFTATAIPTTNPPAYDVENCDGEVIERISILLRT